MGVKGLWEAVSEVKTEVSLAELGGLTLAVDLSVWICQCKSVQHLPPVQTLRTLFYRTTRLMNLGVKLVFVLDGTPPDLKTATMEHRQAYRGSPSKGRQSFNSSSLVTKARQLLQSLGLPCLDAPGEAEALCAQLSHQQLVDGCITQDGDALLYGARRVFKNFTLDKQIGYVESYSAEDIQVVLGLSQQDLICLALLTGCDYNPTGVRQVGVEKTLRLLKHLKNSHASALDRVCNWRQCPELDQLQTERDQIAKERHCGQCHHPGTVNLHRDEGCGVCVIDKGCFNAADTEGGGDHGNKPLPCPCDWHKIDREFSDHRLELNIREKALQHEDFPNMKIVKEFSGNPESKFVKRLQWKKPSLSSFLENCAGLLQWSEQTSFDKFLPTLVSSDLKAKADKSYYVYNNDTEEFLEPCKILKSCKRDFVACYEVSWKRLKCDMWSQGNNYTCLVEQTKFAAIFKEMAQEFETAMEKEKAERTPKKRKQLAQKRTLTEEFASGSQQQITKFFSKKKKAT